jgi:hypothetical protein
MMVSTGPPEAFNNNASSTSAVAAHLLCCAESDKAAAEPKAARQAAASPQAASSDELSQTSNDADDKKSELGKGMQLFCFSNFIICSGFMIFWQMLTEKCMFVCVHLRFWLNRWCLLYLIHRNSAPLCAQRVCLCVEQQKVNSACCVCIPLLAGAWAEGRIAACLPGDFFVLCTYVYLAAIANEFC